MREQIKLLVQLQELDKKIQELDQRTSFLPEEIIALQKIISQRESASLEIHNKLEDIEKEHRQQEGELSTKEETLSKYESQLYEVKTNKEYSALMLEINNIKQENSELEGQILEFMEKTDELKENIKNKEGQLKEEKEKLTEEERKNQERVVILKKELGEFQEERKEQSKAIEPNIFSRYEKIRKGKNGLALVLVKAYVCQGCFTKLPPQVINEIMQSKRLVVCERCCRILYLSQVEEKTKND